MTKQELPKLPDNYLRNLYYAGEVLVASRDVKVDDLALARELSVSDASELIGYHGVIGIEIVSASDSPLSQWEMSNGSDNNSQETPKLTLTASMESVEGRSTLSIS